MRKNPIQIHIPKTGGTTVRKLLPTPRWSRHHVGLGDERVQRTINRTSNAHVFTFLRDPVDRAVSLYYFFVWSRIQGRKRPKLNVIRSKAWVLSCVARAAQMDINDFWGGMLRDDGLQLTRISHAVVHFKKQSKWLDHKYASKVHCYDFGDFEEEVNRLMRDTGREGVRIPHKMRSVKPSEGGTLNEETRIKIAEWYVDDYLLIKQRFNK